MTKEISNDVYIKLAIIPKHRPVIRDIGDQRDPQPVVTCSCQTKEYPHPNNKGLKTGEWTFVDHFVEVLDKEFHFLDNKEDSTDEDMRKYQKY